MTETRTDISGLARAYGRVAPAPLPPDDPEGLSVSGILEPAFTEILRAIGRSDRRSPVFWTGVGGAGVSTLLGRLAVAEPLAAHHHPIPLRLAESVHLLDAREPDLTFAAFLALADAAPAAGIDAAPDILRELVGGAARKGAAAAELHTDHLRRRMRADGRFRAALREELRADPDRLAVELETLAGKFSRSTFGAFRLTDAAMDRLRGAEVSERVLSAAAVLVGRSFRSEVRFMRALEAVVGDLQALHYKPLFIEHAWVEAPRHPLLLVDDAGKLARGGLESLVGGESDRLRDSGIKLAAPLPPVASILLPSAPICEAALRPMAVDGPGESPPDGSERNRLREVLERRLDPRIAPGEALGPLIRESGGLLRDLLAHARHALGWMAARGEGRLTAETADAAVRHRSRLRRRFFDEAAHGSAARRVAETGTITGVPAAETDYLLRHGFVRPCGPPDAEPWFALHPALAAGKEN
jgi:hypothetical protein